MQIKRLEPSSIQQKSTTENTETNSSSSVNLNSGVGNIKDGFEPLKADEGSTSPLKLNFVKQQMTAYMSSKIPQSANEPMFAVMDEYLKMNDNEIGSAHGSRDIFQTVDTDATSELTLGQTSSLNRGNARNHIDTQGKPLNELKQSASDIKETLLQNAGLDEDKKNVMNRYERISLWIRAREDD